MEYFIIGQHPYFSDTFRLSGWKNKINPEWICFPDFYKTPLRCVLTGDLGKNTPFPDIVTTPFLLFSSLIMDVVNLYGEPVYSRDVVIVNPQEQESRHYYLILLETVERGYVRWGESNLFYMDINGRKEIVASLDFVESILRRGAAGITLEKIELERREQYGK